MPQIFLACPETQDAEDHRRAWACLDDDERARAGGLVFAADRAAFVTAHALVRGVLARATGVPAAQLRFARGPHGRPELVQAPSPGGPIRFNLSHTRGLVGCALTRGHDVGFDVQRTDTPASVEAVLARLSSAERAGCAILSGGARDDRFYTLWTLKEAYVKACGRGLSLPLDSFTVLPHDDGTADVSAGEDGPWTLHHFRVGAGLHRVAVAVRAAAAPLQVAPLQRLGALVAGSARGATYHMTV